MLSSKKSLMKRSAVRVSAALLTLMTTSAVVAVKTDALLLAQSSMSTSAPTSFPLPSAVPSGTTVKLDGSSSMTVINEALKKSFEEKFSGTTVNLAAGGTDKALQSLLKGDIDLAAIGRPLTKEEKAEGLTETTLSREKVAIIVSPENPFKGDITFEQFAKIFRGEIKDWSELGGEPGSIRFVDRPDSSDTRISLSKYNVFLNAPFATGANATQESSDETAAVVKDLGKDGISYAIASQVLDQPNVKIIPMHKTLPDDPRYPFSQPRGYVYKDANPAVLAFLGFATSPAGQAAIAVAKVTEAAAVAAVTPGLAASPVPASVVPDASPTIAVAPVATAEPGGLPGWLGWLLLPLLGGGLWWLSRGRDADPVAAVPPPVAPPVVPPVAPPVVPPVAPPAVPAVAPLPVPPPEVPAAIPAIPAVAAAGVALGAVVLGAVRRSPDSRIVLAPRDAQNAYAYWEAPEEHRAELREQGGKKLKLRVSDVTDIDFDRQPAHSVQEFDCSEAEPDLHIPIPQCDRDYLAELGYVTDDDRWLKLARSHSARVAWEPAIVSDGLNVAGLAGGAVAAGAVAAAGVIAAGASTVMPSATEPLLDPATVVDDSRIILAPRTTDDAYAYWEAPEVSKAALREQGGTKFQLRVYDATDIDLDHHPAHSLQVYDLQSSESDHHVLIPAVDRDYMAEIGYETSEGNWLKLARSNPVRIGADLGNAAVAGVTAVETGIVETGAIAAALTVPPAPSRCSITTLKVHSQRNCFFLDEAEMDKLQMEKSVSKVLEPGQYIIRIKEGGFGYGEGVNEPIVMLWIYGGRVINQKTNVAVGATWSTLNGYDETLNLQVYETANLCCFFFDTHLEDNQGEVTVAVAKI